MILEVQHETRLSYDEPAAESVAEVRMEPASDERQTCRSFHLAVSPATAAHRYADGFGNRVHHFNVLAPHLEMRVLAASVVETHPNGHSLEACEATWPLDIDGGGLGPFEYLRLRGPARYTPRLEPALQTLRPSKGQRVGELVAAVSRYIQGHFAYTPNVTLASSPIDDVLAQGKGVCQDFTHLMIAILRSFGVPARYVSGYIHREDRESQSHAWCEAWLPGLGWFGIDPTNDSPADERFVKVAVGRDFTDVPPNKGVYRGKARETISVRVQTRRLAAVPSLSWQEQLPPLDAPLMSIVSGRGAPKAYEEETQQQ